MTHHVIFDPSGRPGLWRETSVKVASGESASHRPTAGARYESQRKQITVTAGNALGPGRPIIMALNALREI